MLKTNKLEAWTEPKCSKLNDSHSKRSNMSLPMVHLQQYLFNHWFGTIFLLSCTCGKWCSLLMLHMQGDSGGQKDHSWHKVTLCQSCSMLVFCNKIHVWKKLQQISRNRTFSPPKKASLHVRGYILRLAANKCSHWRTMRVSQSCFQWL